MLSGRNDWVETTQAARDTGATLVSRDDSRFSGRAGLIYNFDNGIAPYVSYATSYNPIIGLNAQNQLFLPETGQQTLRYIGSSWADTANTLEVPAVVLGDLAFHYEWQNWRTALNVINLTDKIYVASCAAASSCFYGDRRRVTASVSYKW